MRPLTIFMFAILFVFISCENKPKEVKTPETQSDSASDSEKSRLQTQNPEIISEPEPELDSITILRRNKRNFELAIFKIDSTLARQKAKPFQFETDISAYPDDFQTRTSYFINTVVNKSDTFAFSIIFQQERGYVVRKHLYQNKVWLLDTNFHANGFIPHSFAPACGPRVLYKDFNADGAIEILALYRQYMVGTGANSWSLIMPDSTGKNYRLVKNFDELDSPAYDPVRKEFIGLVVHNSGYYYSGGIVKDFVFENTFNFWCTHFSECSYGKGFDDTDNTISLS